MTEQRPGGFEPNPLDDELVAAYFDIEPEAEISDAPAGEYAGMSLAEAAEKALEKAEPAEIEAGSRCLNGENYRPLATSIIQSWWSNLGVVVDVTNVVRAYASEYNGCFVFEVEGHKYEASIVEFKCSSVQLYMPEGQSDAIIYNLVGLGQALRKLGGQAQGQGQRNHELNKPGRYSGYRDYKN